MQFKVKIHETFLASFYHNGNTWPPLGVTATKKTAEITGCYLQVILLTSNNYSANKHVSADIVSERVDTHSLRLVNYSVAITISKWAFGVELWQFVTMNSQ